MSSITKKELQQLISEGRIKETLWHLRASKVVQQNAQRNQQVLLLLNRYHNWQENKRLGMHSDDELETAHNRLTMAILEFIDQLEEERLELLELPPIPDTIKRPKHPFKGLHWFTRDDARIFFGRNDDIRQLHEALKEGEELILLYGQSGVGKSSLLHAGLMPRLEANWHVHYYRRSQYKDLNNALSNLLKTLKKDRTVIILDQVEEIFTNPGEAMELEKNEMIRLMTEVYQQNNAVQFILGFRKEYLAEIRDLVEALNLDPIPHFLKPLDQFGISEAIIGTSENKSLSRKYCLQIDPGLPASIIEDILKDKASHVAPLLQILLRKMWDLVDDGTQNIIFDHKLYEKVRHKSLEALLDTQLEELKDKFPEETEGGLALDVLKFYTTNLATSKERSDEELKTTYCHQATILGLRKALKDLFVLTGTKAGNRLAHDALGPLIHQKFEQSDKLGQRARRILESKRSEIQTASFKDADDINTLESGQPFMRAWTEEENAAFERGKKAVERQRMRDQNMRRRNFEFAEERILQAILKLQYDYAFEELKKVAELNYGLEKLASYFYEIAFFQNEIGAYDRALVVLAEIQYMDLGRFSDLKKELSLLKETPDPKSIKTCLENLHQEYWQKTHNKYYPQMIDIEGGDFLREGHQVVVDKFKMARYTTTFWQYALFALSQGIKLEEKAPSWGIDGNNPLINVNWYEAIEYANWLSKKQGLSPVYEILKDQKDPNNKSQYDNVKWLVTMNQEANGYRLPTEAEWEFAARGGIIEKDKTLKYSGSNSIEEVAWYNENARRTMPIGQKKPNALNLFDMSGNVREWCWDWHGDYPAGNLKNPTGPDFGNSRILRGGSWYYGSNDCEVSYRGLNYPNGRSVDDGFRLSQGI